MKCDLTQEQLKAVLRYDPETGDFYWVKPPRQRSQLGGKKAGSKVQFWISIGIKRRTYMAHRLAWLYVYGSWPTQHIDHINGDGTDNRIGNLRDVSRNVNMQNKRSAHVTNRVGLLGVVKTTSDRFCARIGVDGKDIGLGTYDSSQEAHAAYVDAKRLLHPGCTI